MTYSHSFEDGPFDLVIRVAGRLSLAGMLEGRARLLADPRLRSGLTVLYDYSDADSRELTAADIRTFAVDSALSRFAFRAVAIVATGDVTFGFSRMFLSLGSVDAQRTPQTVVRTVAEAEAWLCGLGLADAI